MKKTFPVNINGAVFYIDDDAYNLLNDYLDQLHQAFPGEEGKEITDDIEARISEIFSLSHLDNNSVVTIAEVSEVIGRMGSPTDLGAPRPTPDASDAASTNGPTPPPIGDDATTTRKRLFRNERDKMVGGVLSGIACYMGWNTNILRLLYLLLALCTYFWPGVIFYLVAWMVIPPARSPRDYLEMTGKPVTISNIGNSVLNKSGATVSSTFATVMSVVTKVVMAGAAIFCICASIGLAIYLGLRFWGLTDYLVNGDTLVLQRYAFHSYVCIPEALGAICGSISLILLALAIVWACGHVLFKLPLPSRATTITFAIIICLLIIVGGTMIFASEALTRY